MSHALHTLLAAASHGEDVRKSRFLAKAAPVDTPQQALAYVQQASDLSATHNCWAYRIGQDYRFNDDGEPGGTAGRPILQAIEGQGMDRVAVVMTRWYGGIKLGAGGLARAYGRTAAECLRLAERVPTVTMTRLGVRCDFSDLARMKTRLKDLRADIEQETFDATGVTLHLRLPSDVVDDAKARIVDISRGRHEAYELD
jgi:uncharacterized YigZ family protein